MIDIKSTKARRLPPYKGPPYWEREKPQEALTDRVSLSYYPEAGKLQISLLYQDRETGATQKGKTIVIDQEDMIQHPEARKLLLQVLEDWE